MDKFDFNSICLQRIYLNQVIHIIYQLLVAFYLSPVNINYAEISDTKRIIILRMLNNWTVIGKSLR